MSLLKRKGLKEYIFNAVSGNREFRLAIIAENRKDADVYLDETLRLMRDVAEIEGEIETELVTLQDIIPGMVTASEKPKEEKDE